MNDTTAILSAAEREAIAARAELSSHRDPSSHWSTRYAADVPALLRDIEARARVCDLAQTVSDLAPPGGDHFIPCAVYDEGIGHCSCGLPDLRDALAALHPVTAGMGEPCARCGGRNWVWLLQEANAGGVEPTKQPCPDCSAPAEVGHV